MLNIYVANLGKYNEGELEGDWLELPQEEEEIKTFLKEKVGINEEYEEFAILDYETDIEGLKVEEYDNIFEINSLTKSLEDLDVLEKIVLGTFLKDGANLGNAIEKVMIGDYCYYDNCYDMRDVAEQYCENCGILDNIPANLRCYFNFEAYGRDMEIEGTFYPVSNGYVELIY